MSTEDVRRQVHAAADTIDVPSPDPGGLIARAQESRDAPRRSTWVLVAAFVLILGVAVTMVAKGSNGPGLATDPDVMVAADSEALAALAIAHLELDTGQPVLDIFGESEGLLGARIASEPDSRSLVGPGLMVAVDEVHLDDICQAGSAGCASLSTSRGDVNLIWGDEMEGVEGLALVDQPMYGVAWRDPITDDFEYVLHFGAAFTGDPRDAELPFAIDDLIGLLIDERFGFMTTTELADTNLAGWRELPE